MRTSERKRDLERAREAGDLSRADAERLAGENGRLERTLGAFLRALVGQTLYVETVTMNYVAELVEVFTDSYDLPVALVYRNLQRVGEWGADGIDANFTQIFPGEQVLQWAHITHTGPQPSTWK